MAHGSGITLAVHIEFIMFSRRRKKGVNTDYILWVGCLTYIILFSPKVKLPGKCYPYFTNEEVN